MPPDALRLARRARGLARRVLAPPPPAAEPLPRTLSLEEIGSLPRHMVEQASRAEASPAFLGDGLALCRMLTRYKFHVDSSDATFGPHLLLDGYWESWLTRFVARTVKPGWSVADIGAYCGYYTLLLADLVGPEGEVFAVEPHPGAAALLRRSVVLNGFAQRTRIFETAAGREDGASGTLYFRPGHLGGGSLVAGAEAEQDWSRIHVGIARMDGLVPAGRRLDFVKIDAEGSEEDIVAGMERLLAEHQPILVLEFNRRWYSDPAGFLRRLEALYGSLAHIDMMGEAAPIAPERLLERDEDWILCLDPR